LWLIALIVSILDTVSTADYLELDLLGISNQNGQMKQFLLAK